MVVFSQLYGPYDGYKLGPVVASVVFVSRQHSRLVNTSVSLILSYLLFQRSHGICDCPS